MAAQVVLDANAALGLFLHLPHSAAVAHQVTVWEAVEVRPVVPILWEYECLTALRRAVSASVISSGVADRLAEGLNKLEFTRIAPSLELHRAALRWANRTGQSKAYDAQYLALAESLSAEFWTADQKLFRSLEALGVDWVHLFRTD